MSTEAVSRPAVNLIRKMIKIEPAQLILLTAGCRPALKRAATAERQISPSATQLLGFLVALGFLALQQLFEGGVEVRAFRSPGPRLPGNEPERIIKISRRRHQVWM